MNRNLLIGSIAAVVVMAIVTILIVAKVNSSPKTVPVQVTAVADVKVQKSPETEKTDKPVVQPSAEKKNEAPDMTRMIKELLEDPEKREIRRKMCKIQTGRNYAPLFNDLKLDDAKREEFNEIMADYVDKATISRFSDSDGASKQEDGARIQAELDEDMKALLGADFPKYQEFKDSMQSRQTVEMLNQNLAGDEKIDPEVQANLVKVLTEESKVWQSTLSSSNVVDKLNRGLSPEAFDKLEKSTAELNKKCLERAATYLNEIQLKAFKEILDQQMSMFQTHFKKEPE